jgi:hypothetical protein
MRKCFHQILIATLGVAIFVSCRPQTQTVSNNPVSLAGVALLKLQMPTGHTALGDSIQILFYDGENVVESTTKIISDELSELEIERVPQNIKLWAQGLLWSKGVVLYKGGRYITANAGQVTQIEIAMVPQFAQIQLAFPLKAYFDYGIKGGTFKAVNTTGRYETVLDTTGRPPLFKIQVLPFGSWNVTLRLWDALGDTLFFADTLMTLGAENSWSNLVLNTSLASVKAVFLFDPAPIHGGTLQSASAVRRSVKQGDIYITEWMANPKVSGNDYEWIELYNASYDTLNLAHCAIRRARSSTAATVAVAFSESSQILPGEWAIMGRDSIVFRNFAQGGFTLSNSGQEVLLMCGTELVDSISYTAEQALAGRSYSRIPGTFNQGCTEVEVIPHFPEFKGSPGLPARCL